MFDLSRLSADDRREIKELLRKRGYRLIPSDGLDDDNRLLNGIRSDLYQDISVPDVEEPDIPDDYQVNHTAVLAQAIIVLVLITFLIAMICGVISNRFGGVLLYAIIGVTILILASLIRK